MYTKLGLQSTRSMNVKNCTKRAADQKYVGMISDIRYG